MCTACQAMRARIAALFARAVPEIAIDELKISQYGALTDPDGKITYVGPLSDAMVERRSTWGK